MQYKMREMSMYLKSRRIVTSTVLFAFLASGWGTAMAGSKKTGTRVRSAASAASVLWTEPGDLASRNLFYGPGGAPHQPGHIFTFDKEDLDGSNPKFVVRDDQNVKWKVKLGPEARPETVASRLVWAVGYFANEDYFVPQIRIQEMPAHVHRGQKFFSRDGSVKNVRLKRYLKGEKKVGNWSWKDETLSGSRELNGLRVMMALLNNWDLKDENNGIFEEKSKSGEPERVYLVSDLGATFGTTGLVFPLPKARGNIEAYAHSHFIRKTSPEYVDFQTPSRPSLELIFSPAEFIRRMKLESIGRRIPIEDVRWIGGLLARLSSIQIHDAFRAGGYSPEQVDAFANVVKVRIEQLRGI
jgi:hypothetical protein